METPRAITKILTPSRRSSLLHRPRLVDFLLENIDRKLLLVSASAGYGKTSLLVDLAHEPIVQIPVCWYSLDSSDSDPKVFLEYLIASLRLKFPDFGERTLQLLSSSSLPRDIEVVIGTLVTDIHDNIPSMFVLVLDDYHTIDESNTINHIIDTLLRLLPENAHIIIASRTLPSKLTLTRLTAKQDIAGLGVNDLRFTADEIHALVKQNYQVDLSETDAAELARHSEGWIAGLLLTTHSLWRGLFQDLVRAQNPQNNVFTYLATEVFNQQSPDLQQFLLQSSVFDHFSPDLCDEVLRIENSRETLHQLEQNNLFITRLEGNELWYRYHHLFQDFLHSRFRDSDLARWYDLHRRAAAFFESRHDWGPAIDHLLQAQTYADAARLIEQIAKEIFDAGHWTTLGKWIDSLPAQLLDSHPGLLVLRGIVFAQTGVPQAALETLSRALSIYEQHNDTPGIARTLIRQAVCQRLEGDYERAIQNSQRALTLLNDQATPDCAEAHRTIGTSFGLAGNWQASIRELEIALQIYTVLNDWPRIALMHHDLGVAYRIAGNNQAAHTHFQEALDFWRRANNSAGLANTLNSVGVEYHRQGKYQQAVETLEQAREQAHRLGQLRVEALILASLGDVSRDQADYPHAREMYKTAFEIAQRINEGFIITFSLTGLGETLRLLGDRTTANDLLGQASEQARNHQSNYEIGLTLTAQGILDLAQGNPDAAIIHLNRALELLEQGGAKRDSARAHLHLANALWQQRKLQAAHHHLNVAATLGLELDEKQFAMMDREILQPLIRYAISKKIEPVYYTEMLTAMESLAATRTETAPIVPETQPRLELRGLGTAQVLVDGKLITRTIWDSAKAKELFFFMAAHPQGLRREQIFEALWPELPNAKANAIFHSTSYRLRRAVLPECMAIENGMYRLSSKIELAYDVIQFRQWIDQAEAANTTKQRQAAYQSAIALYQGDFFEDCYSDWCVPIRTALQQAYIHALSRLARLHEQAQEQQQALTLYQTILDKDNCNETVYRAVMQLQLKLKDSAGALKTYQRCHAILQDELHLPPSTATQMLYRKILNKHRAAKHR